MKSFSPGRNDEGCVLTIFTPVARPSLSDDDIDSCLCFASPPLTFQDGISADLRLPISKTLMNGPNEITFAIVGQPDR